MNIVHISDFHFGPRHWDGNDDILLKKINSYNADIIIYTGDSTTDGLEREYIDAKKFLDKVKCKHLIPIIGNHDKRNMSGSELFKKYIYNPNVIYPDDDKTITKKHLFLDREITKIKDNFTDINFLETVNIEGKIILFICIDSNLLYSDYGYVEESILEAVSKKMNKMEYDIPFLITHYPLLGTDDDVFINSRRLIGFVNKHKIKYVFCGHNHELDIRKSHDLYYNHQFFQFMCGSTSSCNHKKDDNMFIFYENFGEDNFHIYIIRIFPENNDLIFKEERVF